MPILNFGLEIDIAVQPVENNIPIFITNQSEDSSDKINKNILTNNKEAQGR